MPIRNTGANPVTAAATSFTVNGTPLGTSSLSGVAFVDFNDDGQVDFGEQGIAGVTVTVDGTDFLGNPVDVAKATDSDGAFVFSDLRPGH